MLWRQCNVQDGVCQRSPCEFPAFPLFLLTACPGGAVLKCCRVYEAVWDHGQQLAGHNKRDAGHIAHGRNSLFCQSFSLSSGL